MRERDSRRLLIHCGQFWTVYYYKNPEGPKEKAVRMVSAYQLF